jgi:hypothetical protein
MNATRRHQNESQRAMVAARLATLKSGIRTDRQGAKEILALSQEEAATKLNVSERMVRYAKIIIESGDEKLIAEVDKGEKRVTKAVSEIQGKPVQTKKKKVGATAKPAVESPRVIEPVKPIEQPQVVTPSTEYNGRKIKKTMTIVVHALEPEEGKPDFEVAAPYTNKTFAGLYKRLTERKDWEGHEILEAFHIDAYYIDFGKLGKGFEVAPSFGDLKELNTRIRAWEDRVEERSPVKKRNTKGDGFDYDYAELDESESA